MGWNKTIVWPLVLKNRDDYIGIWGTKDYCHEITCQIFCFYILRVQIKKI